MNVTLQPVTAENWRALIKLKVREDQNGFVASNLYSIAESQFGFEYEGSWIFIRLVHMLEPNLLVL